MKPKTKILLTISLLLVGLLVYRFYTNPYNLSADDFKQVYKTGDAANQENYEVQCKEEFDKNISFPLGQVSKAVLCKGFFSVDKTLSEANTKKIVEILNDTSSYVWGEIGTFIPDKQIVFYDKDNKPLGFTELEEERGLQSYSYPYLRRMKWGALTGKAFEQIEKLITE
jgi:hypothetical protein